MFLDKHDPAYIGYMERQRDALINHQTSTSPPQKPIVSEHYYHDVFVKEFNLHFGFPRSDTCDTCDSFKIRIEAPGTEEDKAKLREELQAHLKKLMKAMLV